MTDVSEDTDLTPAEKEFHISVDKDRQRLHVHSEIASVTRALLKRPKFEKEEQRTIDGEIVAVSGTLPMGVLKIQKAERQYGSFSNIVAEVGGE